MNDLNWPLILVAFLAGVILTLLWSLRKVTRKVFVDPPVDEAQAAEQPAAEEPELATVAAAALTSDSPPPSSTGTGAGTELDEISWWDRSFVAHRPAPAISSTELEATTREFSYPSNRNLVGPDGERIKGSRESMLYHTIASPYYGRTQAEEWFASEADAEAAGFTRWDRRKLASAKAAAAPVAPAEPSKPRNGVNGAARNGSARNGLNGAGLNGSGLNGAGLNGSSHHGEIKGNRGSMLYHTVDSPYYGRTKAEEWFSTEDEAAAAGYRRWDHKRAART